MENRANVSALMKILTHVFAGLSSSLCIIPTLDLFEINRTKILKYKYVAKYSEINVTNTGVTEIIQIEKIHSVAYNPGAVNNISKSYDGPVKNENKIVSNVMNIPKIIIKLL